MGLTLLSFILLFSSVMWCSLLTSYHDRKFLFSLLQSLLMFIYFLLFPPLSMFARTVQSWACWIKGNQKELENCWIRSTCAMCISTNHCFLKHRWLNFMLHALILYICFMPFCEREKKGKTCTLPIDNMAERKRNQNYLSSIIIPV